MLDVVFEHVHLGANVGAQKCSGADDVGWHRPEFVAIYLPR